MPHRQIVLTTREIYHIFNRGVNGAPIFTSSREYSRFVNLIEFYRFDDVSLSYSHFKRLKWDIKENFIKNLKSNKQYRVDILAFCLMPNHFHLLLHQQKDMGISKMLSDLQNGYVRYFNIRNNRLGPLFQSVFKAVRIESDEQLLHVSRYIHLNPVTSYIMETEELETYPWSSFNNYIGPEIYSFVNTSMVLDLIGSRNKYKNFVIEQYSYQRELAKIKHLTLENT